MCGDFLRDHQQLLVPIIHSNQYLCNNPFQSLSSPFGEARISDIERGDGRNGLLHGLLEREGGTPFREGIPGGLDNVELTEKFSQEKTKP